MKKGTPSYWEQPFFVLQGLLRFTLMYCTRLVSPPQTHTHTHTNGLRINIFQFFQEFLIVIGYCDLTPTYTKF